MDFTLFLGERSFPVPKKRLLDFFEMHPSLFDESSYEVQGPVSADHPLQFVTCLSSKQLPDITPANGKNLYLLSQEFGLAELASQSSGLVPVHDDSISNSKTNLLSDARLSESFRRDFPLCFWDSVSRGFLRLEKEIAELRGEFETHRSRFSSIAEELRVVIPEEVSKLESRVQADLSVLKSTCDQFQRDIDGITAIPQLLPLYPEAPLNGIIAYLTRKHGGNVHPGTATSESRSKRPSRRFVLEDESRVNPRIEAPSSIP